MKKWIRKVKNNNRIIILYLSTIVIMISLFITIYSKEYSSSDEVFEINNESVSKAEFSNLMMALKGNVYSYIVQKYGGGDSAKFWTTSFNGEVPEEILKKQTFEKLKKIKVEQILFKKYGIVGDISYPGFLKALENENIRREKAVEKKEPIFGPVKYDERIYYDYLQASNIEKLKNKLLKIDLSSTDEEIKKYYNEKKEELYKKPDSIKFQKISISCLDEKGNITSDSKAHAKETMDKMIIDIENNVNFSDVRNTYINKTAAKIEYKEQSVNGDIDRDANNIIDGLNGLQVGQVSQVLEGADSLYIVRKNEVTPTGFLLLSDVKSKIMYVLADEKFNEMVERLIKEVNININSKVYKSIAA
ncbi:peptidyl-prolyl cis-trans isomerase [Clostridium estertheticum]|uniref:peptidylprolyl isomerase n=1 Tax=Clostridium estertheticum TaxID=238834 RepID=UPI001C0C2B3F|nr:peptidylprolyl isomerase [Clostridium estertheticum]MBU3199932.1 peptidyl-prolyl cis-trans isomerase [Clostridium estertheticum]WAG66970.1 peptidyl-prolyl cis-trans isomerase [Clostridium estertheticum]